MEDLDDQADVDMSSGSLTSSSSSSTLNLSKDSLDGLNINMAHWSSENWWIFRMERAGGDRNACHELAVQVLQILTGESVANTKLKDKIIASPRIGDARNIVKGFNDEEWQRWYSGMQTGLKDNNWVNLINHSKLRTRKVPNVALGVPIQYQHAVASAWRLPYRGDADKILVKAIDELHQQCNYAKILPIVQSSGTGKSKTVDEVAKMRILFPLCLRGYIGENYFAYPLSDEVVRDYLLRAPSVKEAECKQYLESFLSALFTTARLQAQKLFSGDEKVSYESMAMTFHRFFADRAQRDEFYDAVVQNAEDHTALTSIWNALLEFKGVLKDHCVNWLPNGQCPLLFSLDEVHELYTRRGIDKGSVHTLYSRLKSVLHEGAEHDFAVISLSTVNHISSIAPSKETTSSMREKYQEGPLPAPFTELPFDVYIIHQPLTSNQETLGSVGSLEFTAKFGRPLFYSSYLSRKGLPNIVNGIMVNVQEKLSGRLWPPEKRAETIDASSIAILSARLLLDLSPATTFAKPFEEELVRNHLCMLYSAHENRQMFVTGSSPEPLIAEAAAQIMNYSFTNGEVTESYMDVWNLLSEFVDHGLASQCAIGELIGRALSISAMDRAINGFAQVCQLKYQAVLVTDYYKALLTDEAWNDLRRSVPANHVSLDRNSATKSFEEAFRNAYFHFSHYAKANDSFPIRDTHAWALWLRGTAVVLNQELTDRMTPIYFATKGNVSPKTISVNLDQDKTSQSMNPANVAIQSTEALQIFSDGNKLPYIAAVHCYALTEDEGLSVKLSNASNTRGQISNDSAAPRYQIDFRGLSAYRNITDTSRNLIQAMINRGKNAVFAKHPRRYGVESLHRMLPVLSSDPASTQWFTVPGNVKQTNSVSPNKRQKATIAGPSTAGSQSRQRK